MAEGRFFMGRKADGFRMEREVTRLSGGYFRAAFIT